MEDKNYTYLILTIFGAIIIPFFAWYFKKEEVERLIHKYSPFKRIHRDSILKLEDSHLIIENKEFLNDFRVSKKFKYIFWPVTPTDSPNLVHLLSIYYLNKLSESGLRIIVFVFDSYYEMIQNNSTNVAHQKVLKFQEELKKMGLRNCWYKIESESKYIDDVSANTEFAKRFYKYMGSLNYGDLMKLKKPHVEDHTPSIRFFKPTLNMLYLKLVPYKIGFTFSGYDEKALWDTFIKNKVDGQNMRLTNFYLPTLPTLSGGQTDVLDKTNNITVDDSENDIYNKIFSNQQCLEDKGLIRMTLEVFLMTGETISIQINNTDFKKYSRFEEIESDLQDDKLKKKIISSISQEIYGLFHQ
jgi:hypothetical protein